jgi:hypothetical protein
MKALEVLKDMRKDCPSEWQEVDDAIEELEELQNRSCKSCVHFSWDGRSIGVCHCISRQQIYTLTDFYCKYHKRIEK